MNIRNIFWLILFLGVLGTSFTGTLSWSQPKAGGEVNLIMEEMTALDQAFKTIIDGVVLGLKVLSEKGVKRPEKVETSGN